MVTTLTLEELLARYAVPGSLYERLPEGAVRCVACGHRCLIRDGKRGVCMVRVNRGGALYVPHGYVGALQCDPIEKKPFFHVLPGARALSFGMLGCDYHCLNCQNFMTSQALRDPVAGLEPEEMAPEQFVTLAKRLGAQVVTSTYNEPLITSEWAVEVFKVAKREGLVTSYVSNGNATPEVLEYIQPWVDLYKVDLKGFNEPHYRTVLGGQLKTVLETIRLLKQMAFWVEVVTLIIPGFNDSDEELKAIAEFLTSVSPEIPWHVTAFHKDYKMTDPDNTPADTLIRACEIGQRAGLRYLYAGNLPGLVGPWEDTRCPSCNELLVERRGYTILKNILRDGRCPSCQTAIPGRWSLDSGKVARWQSG